MGYIGGGVKKPQLPGTSKYKVLVSRIFVQFLWHKKPLLSSSFFEITGFSDPNFEDPKHSHHGIHVGESLRKSSQTALK